MSNNIKASKFSVIYNILSMMRIKYIKKLKFNKLI